jgi:TRAP-type mannitol/chloroaromatic compound transport system permease large subunit
MTDPQVAIFMLSTFIFLVLLGFPIAFTLVSMGVGFGYYAYFQADNLLNNQIFYLLNQNTYSVMERISWLPYLYFCLWVMWLKGQISSIDYFLVYN